MSDPLRPSGYLSSHTPRRTRWDMALCWLVMLLSALSFVAAYAAVRVLFALMVMHAMVR